MTETWWVSPLLDRCWKLQKTHFHSNLDIKPYTLQHYSLSNPSELSIHTKPNYSRKWQGLSVREETHSCFLSWWISRTGKIYHREEDREKPAQLLTVACELAWRLKPRGAPDTENLYPLANYFLVTFTTTRTEVQWMPNDGIRTGLLNSFTPEVWETFHKHKAEGHWRLG